MVYETDVFVPVPLHKEWTRKVLRNGFFRVVYESGDIYEGDFAQGYRHGTGTYFFREPPGSRYEGEFRKDEFSGKGVYHYEQDVYNGLWLHSAKHGEGNYVDKKDNSTYQGQWSEGYKHGLGKSDDKDGLFSGEFLAGLRHGTGTMLYRDAGDYAGKWQAGARHGHGTMRYKDGSHYSGGWVDNASHGTGVLLSHGVGTYTGEFVGGKRDGEGEIVYDAGDVRSFSGTWSCGMKVSGVRKLRAGGMEYVLYQQDTLIRREDKRLQ